VCLCNVSTSRSHLCSDRIPLDICLIRNNGAEGERKYGDASVPFGFDTHALFFSRDAVGIESAMHDRLAAYRVNGINLRREFFRVTVAEAKAHLSELAGELLEFHEFAEADEYRQTVRLSKPGLEPRSTSRIEPQIAIATR